MGNSNSATDGRQPTRPPLRTQVSNASSVATVVSSRSQGSGSKRRKSIELPDLDPSLAFTSSTTASPFTPQTSPTAVKTKLKPRDSLSRTSQAGRGTEYETPSLITPSATTLSDVSASDLGIDHSGESDILLGTNAQDLQTQQEGNLEGFLDDGARLTPSLRKHVDELSVTPAAPVPAVVSHVLKETTKQSVLSPDSIPLPHSFSTVDAGAPTEQMATLSVATANGFSSLPPLKSPTQTVIAPEVPQSVSDLPLGTAATHESSAIIGSPIPSAAGTPVASPSLQQGASIAALLPDLSPSGHAHSLPNVPLPAAAPLDVLTEKFANDPAVVEAVKSATVDLGAGSEGVPTLLTWTPGVEAGNEGLPPGEDPMPKQVYVTGTFAKGWTTKIELRKKKSQTDFSALVNLPPGHHRLKFIVDKQWKTSRNLPSATDQDGNLINYLQVSVPGQASAQAPTAHQQQKRDEEEYWQELLEARWTTTIPEELVAFGEMQEAEEIAYEEQEEVNRQLVERGLPPNPMYAPQVPVPHPVLRNTPAPPSLPAQLHKGVLNSIVLVAEGSGDDNSLLPKPDHSVIDHLAASPITKGLLSVAVTKRYRKKFVTTVLFKTTPGVFERSSA